MSSWFVGFVPVWIIAGAIAVDLLVLAIELHKICEGYSKFDQYDHQHKKIISVVMRSWVQFLSNSLRRNKGRKKRKKRKDRRISSRSWCKQGSYILGLVGLMLLSIFLITTSISAENKGNLTEIYPQVNNLIPVTEYISHRLYTDILLPKKNQKSYLFTETSITVSIKVLQSGFSTANKKITTCGCPMANNNKVITEVNTVTQLSHQLGNTMLGNTSVIVHSNSDSSDTEETQVQCELIGKFISEGRVKFKVVEKNLKFAWDFLNTDEDVKVFEIDQNFMIFNFGENGELKDYVFNTRPWSIDGNLVILHPYEPSTAYTDLDWNHQPFWIEIRDLLPELMNQKTVTDMGRIMGEVIDIEPKVGLPKSGDYFRVCVKIDITTPLRRGLLCMTAANTTKWIGFFYEKQPSKICKECYVLKHSKEECKKVASTLETLHSQIHFFNSMRGAKKIRNPTPTKMVPSMRMQLKKSAPSARFIPPKDGVSLLSHPVAVTDPTETEISSSTIQGVSRSKRHRSADHGDQFVDTVVTEGGITSDVTLKRSSTATKVPTGNPQRILLSKQGGDKGNAGGSEVLSNMES